MPAAFHLSAIEEKAAYDQHENSPEDQEYRQFLGRLFHRIRNRVPRSSIGLDYGSGPGPTLSVMFEEVGHRMAIYDPFYAPVKLPLDRQYDFVTCSEVVEHFRTPRDDMQRLWSCVKPGGLLGIMTQLALDRADFSHWYYKNDPTHVSFYSRVTFEWLAVYWRAELTFVGSDVILMEKPESFE